MLNPTARKFVDGVTIYESQYAIGNTGPLYLCDFGNARVSEKHQGGGAMPLRCQPPEIIFDMPWGPKVDMWSVGIVVSTSLINFLLSLYFWNLCGCYHKDRFSILNTLLGMGLTGTEQALQSLRLRESRAQRS